MPSSSTVRGWAELSDPPAGDLTLTQRNTTMASMKKKKKAKKAEKKPS
jgi:hypothetical protein